MTGLWVLPLSLLAGTVATALFGAAFGVAAARLRGPYLAGATLALGVALPSITSHFEVFKGDQGLFVPFDPPPAGLGDDFSLEHWQAWISLGAALITLFLLANLQSSAVGRHMRAVRDDEIAASLAGLSVPRTQILAFTVSSAAAGLGGGVFAFVLQTASPGSFGLVLSLTLLSAVIIGGLGSLTGAVLGSVIVVYLGTWLTDWIDGLGLDAGWAQNLHDHLPNATYGLLLILVMLLLPGGLAGLLRRIPLTPACPADRPADHLDPHAPANDHHPATPPPAPTHPTPRRSGMTRSTHRRSIIQIGVAVVAAATLVACSSSSSDGSTSTHVRGRHHPAASCRRRHPGVDRRHRSRRHRGGLGGRLVTRRLFGRPDRQRRRHRYRGHRRRNPARYHPTAHRSGRTRLLQDQRGDERILRRSPTRRAE